MFFIQHSFASDKGVVFNILILFKYLDIAFVGTAVAVCIAIAISEPLW